MMTHQTEMALAPAIVIQPSAYMTEFQDYRSTDIGRAAYEFDKNNPHVYALFEKFSRQVLDQGRGKFGVGAIWERLRWESVFTTTDKVFKISNNHRSYYARRLMAENKAFEGFFVIHGARGL